MSLSNLIVKRLLSCFMVEYDFQCWSIEDSFMREELHVQLYKIFLKRKFFQLNSFPCKIWVKKVFFFLHRRFVYHIWNHWFADVDQETLREIANSQERNGDCNTDNINRTARRTSPSIIPSLLELASSSFKILTESKSRSRLKTPITDGTFLPLSTSSEFKFCDGVIAECKGPEGEVQRSCALNYKRWLLIRSTPHQLNCNGAAFTPKVVTEPGLS